MTSKPLEIILSVQQFVINEITFLWIITKIGKSIERAECKFNLRLPLVRECESIVKKDNESVLQGWTLPSF